MEKEMSAVCVAQCSEQSTGNRKNWARIPAQSEASFFYRKISNSSKICIQFSFIFDIRAGSCLQG